MLRRSTDSRTKLDLRCTKNTVEVIYTVNTRLANESRLIWQFSNFAPRILEEMSAFLRDFNLNFLCLKFNKNEILLSLSRYREFALGKFLWIYLTRIYSTDFSFHDFNVDIYSHDIKF